VSPEEATDAVRNPQRGQAASYVSGSALACTFAFSAIG